MGALGESNAMRRADYKATKTRPWKRFVGETVDGSRER
jgi:hypothetical protein